MGSKSLYDELIAEAEAGAIDDPYADILGETSDQVGPYDDLLKEAVAIEDPLLDAPGIAPDPTVSLPDFGHGDFRELPELYTEGYPGEKTEGPFAVQEEFQTIARNPNLSQLIEEYRELGDLRGLQTTFKHYSDHLSGTQMYDIGRAAMKIIKDDPLGAVTSLNPSPLDTTGMRGDLPPVAMTTKDARSIFNDYFAPEGSTDSKGRIALMSGSERETSGNPLIIGGMVEHHSKIPRFSDDIMGWGAGNIWGFIQATSSIPMIPLSAGVAAYSDWEYVSSSPEPSDDVKAMRKVAESGSIGPRLGDSKRPVHDFINPVSDDRHSVMESMVSLVSPTPGPINGEFPEFGKRMGVTQVVDFPAAKGAFSYGRADKPEIMEGAGAISRIAVRHNKHPIEVILAMSKVMSNDMSEGEFQEFIQGDSELAKEAILSYRNLAPKDVVQSTVANRAWQIADDFDDSAEAVDLISSKMSELGRQKIKEAISEGGRLGIYGDPGNEHLLDLLEIEWVDRRTKGSITAQYLYLIKQMPGGMAHHIDNSIRGLLATPVAAVSEVAGAMDAEGVSGTASEFADFIDPWGVGRDQWQRETLFSLLDFTALAGGARLAGKWGSSAASKIESVMSERLIESIESSSSKPKPPSGAREHGAGPEWEQKPAPGGPSSVVSDIPLESVESFGEAAKTINDAFGERPNVVEGIIELPDIKAMEAALKHVSEMAEGGITQLPDIVTRSPQIKRWVETIQERTGVAEYEAAYILYKGKLGRLRALRNAQDRGHTIVDSQGVGPLSSQEAMASPASFESTSQVSRIEAIRRRARAKEATHPEEAAAELRLADAVEKRINDANRLASKGRVLGDIPSGGKLLSEMTVERIAALAEESPIAALEELISLYDDGFRLSIVEDGIPLTSEGPSMSLGRLARDLQSNYERSSAGVIKEITESLIQDVPEFFQGGARGFGKSKKGRVEPKLKSPGESPALDQLRFTLEDIQIRKAIERGVDGVERIDSSNMNIPLEVRGEILANYRKLPTEVQWGDMAVEGVRDPSLYLMVSSDARLTPWSAHLHAKRMAPFIEEAARVDSARLRTDSFGRRTTLEAVDAQSSLETALMESGLTEAQWNLEVNQWQSAESLVDAGWTHPDAYHSLGFSGKRAAEFASRAAKNPAQSSVKFKPSGSSRAAFATKSAPKGVGLGEPGNLPTYWGPEGRRTVSQAFTDLFFGKRVRGMRDKIMAPLEGEGAPRIGKGLHPSERPHFTEPFLEWLEHPFAFVQLPGWIGDFAMNMVYRSGDGATGGLPGALLAPLVGPRNRLGPIYQDIQAWRVRQRHRAGVAADVLSPLKGGADDIVSIGADDIQTLLDEAGIAYQKDPRTGRLINDAPIASRNLEAQRVLAALAEYDKTFVIKDANGLKSTLGDWVTSEVQTNGAWVALDDLIARVDRGEISLYDAHVSVTDTRFSPRKGLSWDEIPTEARNAVTLGNKFIRPFGAYLWDRTAQALSGAISTKLTVESNGVLKTVALFDEAHVRKNMGRWVSEYYNEKMMSDYWIGLLQNSKSGQKMAVTELALDQADLLFGKVAGGPRGKRLSDIVESGEATASVLTKNPTVERFYKERLMKEFDHSFKNGEVLDMAKLSEMSEAYGISPQLILQRNRGDFALPTLQEFASGATFKFQKKSKLKIPTSLNRKMEMGLADFSDRMIATVHGIEQNLANMTLAKTLREHGMILTEVEKNALSAADQGLFGELTLKRNQEQFSSVFNVKSKNDLYMHRRAMEYFEDIQKANEAAVSMMAGVSTTMKLALIANPLGTVPRNILTNVAILGMLAPIPMKSTRVLQFHKMWMREKNGKIDGDMQKMRDAGFGASDVALNEFEALLQEKYMAYEVDILHDIAKSAAESYAADTRNSRGKAYEKAFSVLSKKDDKGKLAALSEQFRTSSTHRSRAHERKASEAVGPTLRDKTDSLGRSARAGRSQAAKLYGSTDTVQRGGYVLELVYDHGMSWRDAVATANRYLTDYMDVAPLFDSMSRNLGVLGAPFVRWTATSSQLAAEAVHMRPLRFMALNSALTAHNKAVGEILGYSEDYVKATGNLERGIALPRIGSDVLDSRMARGSFGLPGGMEGAIGGKMLSSYKEGIMTMSVPQFDISGVGKAFSKDTGVDYPNPQSISGREVSSLETVLAVLASVAPEGGVLLPLFEYLSSSDTRNDRFYNLADEHSDMLKLAGMILQAFPAGKVAGDILYESGVSPRVGMTPSRGKIKTYSGALGATMSVSDPLETSTRVDAKYKKGLQSQVSGINQMMAQELTDALYRGESVGADELGRVLSLMNAVQRYSEVERLRGQKSEEATKAWLKWVQPRFSALIREHPGSPIERLLTGPAKDLLREHLDKDNE